MSFSFLKSEMWGWGGGLANFFKKVELVEKGFNLFLYAAFMI